MTDDPENTEPADEDVTVDEDGTAYLDCDHHILCIKGGLGAFLEANGAEAARVSRKTAEIELACAETHQWRDYGKPNRTGAVAAIKPR